MPRPRNTPPRPEDPPPIGEAPDARWERRAPVADRALAQRRGDVLRPPPLLFQGPARLLRSSRQSACLGLLVFLCLPAYYQFTCLCRDQ